MRWSFRSLLTVAPSEREALVEAMTPHGWRAGIAGDLHREGLRPVRIMKVGRWSSKRAMTQYVRDGLAQRLESPSFAAISAVMIARAPRGNAAPHDSARLFGAAGSSGGESSGGEERHEL